MTLLIEQSLLSLYQVLNHVAFLCEALITVNLHCAHMGLCTQREGPLTTSMAFVGVGVRWPLFSDLWDAAPSGGWVTAHAD